MQKGKTIQKSQEPKLTSTPKNDKVISKNNLTGRNCQILNIENMKLKRNTYRIKWKEQDKIRFRKDNINKSMKGNSKYLVM